MAYNNIKYLDYNTIKESLTDYSSPKAKITGLLKKGNLIKLRRNLYISSGDKSTSLNTLANIILSPSYISFEYALSFYNMIPERVEVITSGAYNTTKNKLFHTPLGIFEYRYINNKVYPYGIIRKYDNDNPFLIASREKALCDTLSKISPAESIKGLQYLLFDDLRLDSQELFNSDKSMIRFLSEIYHQRNIKLLAKFIEKGK